MLCPKCLTDVTFESQVIEDEEVHLCPVKDCRQQVWDTYVPEYHEYPPVPLSAVGFSGHGKTVYFASLYLLLEDAKLHRNWPKFFKIDLDEDSEATNTIISISNELRKGICPDPTNKVFLNPTAFRLNNTPGQPDCTLLCYDTGGETFLEPHLIKENAKYIKKSPVVLFLINIPELIRASKEENGKPVHSQIFELLTKYLRGMRKLRADTKKQDLIIVYTCADMIFHLLERGADGLPHWKYAVKYINGGSAANMNPDGYMNEMVKVSRILEDFTEERLEAKAFINAANKYFRSTRFCAVSALGAEPQGKKIPYGAEPKRVIDPLMWVMALSQDLFGEPRKKSRWFSGKGA